MSATPLLEVDGLDVVLATGDPPVHPIRGVSFSIAEGERLGIVGESGSGKSLTAAAVMRQLPTERPEVWGTVRFDGRDLSTLEESELESLRGREIAMVFQNARAALNPLFSIGEQIADVYRTHTGAPPEEAWGRAVELLRRMGFGDAEQRAAAYPHELSGGQCQRAMVAMALICSPRLLIADEPTTGLDATIEAQVLDLIAERIADAGAALMLISHDLGVIREIADRVLVMYAGHVLEVGPTELVLARPANPYTLLLARCADLGPDTGIRYIPGRAPDARAESVGCPFADRCPYALDVCHTERPPLRALDDGRRVACHRAEECRAGNL
jgi:oligopeptide/dipeptide ABC transporter ATP-binding protein